MNKQIMNVIMNNGKNVLSMNMYSFLMRKDIRKIMFYYAKVVIYHQQQQNYRFFNQHSNVAYLFNHFQELFFIYDWNAKFMCFLKFCRTHIISSKHIGRCLAD